MFGNLFLLPNNLNKITPPNLQFEIITDLPAKMFNGLEILYNVKIPFMGKRKWISRIENIQEKKCFVDTQILGPYKYWHHYHEIIETENGIKIVDEITYKPPFGILGIIANKLFIAKMLDGIFKHRKIMFDKLLNNSIRI